MYVLHRSNQFHSTKPGSGDQAEPDPKTKDLMEKLTFLSEKMSHRSVCSTAKKQNNNKMWNSIQKVMEEKKSEGFIVPDGDKFSRTKRLSGDEAFKQGMGDLVNVIKVCAIKFSTNLNAYNEGTADNELSFGCNPGIQISEKVENNLV